jgi:hypothetical protein
VHKLMHKAKRPGWSPCWNQNWHHCCKCCASCFHLLRRVLDSVSRSSRCGRWCRVTIAIMAQSSNTSESHQYPLSLTTIYLDLLWIYANKLEISWLQCFLASNRTTKETESKEFISLVYRTRPWILFGPGFLSWLWRRDLKAKSWLLMLQEEEVKASQ